MVVINEVKLEEAEKKLELQSENRNSDFEEIDIKNLKEKHLILDLTNSELDFKYDDLNKIYEYIYSNIEKLTIDENNKIIAFDDVRALYYNYAFLENEKGFLFTNNVTNQIQVIDLTGIKSIEFQFPEQMPTIRYVELPRDYKPPNKIIFFDFNDKINDNIFLEQLIFVIKLKEKYFIHNLIKIEDILKLIIQKNLKRVMLKNTINKINNY